MKLSKRLCVIAPDLKAVALETRRRTLKSIFHAQSGHLGSSLSIVEILTTLFFKEMNTLGPLRDRFILSKGHGAPSLYAILSLKGLIPQDQLLTLRVIDSPLQGHPVKDALPFMDASTGSLGQGLSIGIGYALASRYKQEDRRVFVILGDGELQEGQNWEAAMAASKFKLDRLTAIVDYNKFQNDGSIEETMPLEPIVDKWQAFGWHVQEVDGHNVQQLLEAYGNCPLNGRPSVIIAHTIKGKGVSFMEGNMSWFCKVLDEEAYALSMKELV